MKHTIAEYEVNVARWIVILRKEELSASRAMRFTRGLYRLNRCFDPYHTTVIIQSEQPRRAGAGPATEVHHPSRLDAHFRKAMRKPFHTSFSIELSALAANRKTARQRRIVGFCVPVKRCPIEVTHFLCMPRTLTKKLESTVWKARAESVAPGTTKRMMRE